MNNETALKLTIANGPGGQSRGTYRHLETRDMHADLAKVRPWRHKRTPGAAGIDVLAKRALAHYLEVSTRENAPDVTDVHVFPVLKSGRGHAADFRRHLAAYIVGHNPDRPIWKGAEYIHTWTGLRAHFESRLSFFDFRFVEVNPADYS